MTRQKNLLFENSTGGQSGDVVPSEMGNCPWTKCPSTVHEIVHGPGLDMDKNFPRLWTTLKKKLISSMSLPNEILSNLSAMLEKNELQLVEKKNVKNKELWSKFAVIFYGGNLYESHAVCRECCEIICIVSEKTSKFVGTNVLSRHKCAKSENDVKISGFASNLKPLVPFEKKILKEKMTKYCIKSI